MTTLAEIREKAALHRVLPAGMASRSLATVVKDWPEIRDGLLARGEPEFMQPEVAALWFYLQNHIIGALRTKIGENVSLTDDQLLLVHDYHDRSLRATLRLMYYLLTSCTREARHASLGYQIKACLPSLAGEWLLAKKKSGGIVSALMTEPPDVPLAAYVAGLSNLFTSGGFSGGYGGKPWSRIADLLFSLVAGKTSPELFLDVGFSIAHNNGPVFNKGFAYSDYKGGNHGLISILNRQRNGQIPDYVAAPENSPYVNTDMQDYLRRASEILGMSPGAIIPAGVKAPTPGVAEPKKPTITVMPGVEVEITEIKRGAS